MTKQELVNRDKIYELFAEEAYSNMLVKRYGITTNSSQNNSKNNFTLLKNLFDFYYPDTPFERMTRHTISKNIKLELFKEKYNLI